MKSKLLILSFFLFASCTKTITNSIDRTVYKCGESARNEQVLVEILGPGGSALSSTEGLEASLVSTSGKVTDLKVTEKGCVALADRELPLNTEFIVRQKTKNINLGRVVTEGPIETSLSLAKVGAELKETECKDPLYQSKGLLIPKKFESWVSSRYLWKAALGTREGYVLALDGSDKASPFFGLDSTDLKEKAAKFTVTDLLTAEAISFSCSVVVDQKAPVVSVSLARDKKYPFIKVDSNSQVDVSAVDDSAADVFYCFSQPGHAGQCEFRKVESGIKTPESGYWELHYYAVDLAGNRSVTNSVPLISWGKDMIENIRLVSKSSIAAESDIEAIRLALTARKTWLDLKTDEEKAEVKELVEFALLKAVNTRKERYRKNVNDLDDTVLSAASSRGFFKIAQSGTVTAWNVTDGTTSEKSIGELSPQEDLVIRLSRDGSLMVTGSSRRLVALTGDLSQSIEIKLPLGSKALLLEPAGDNAFDLIVSSGERYKVKLKDGKISQETLPPLGLSLTSAVLIEGRDLIVADSDEMINVFRGADVTKKVAFPHGRTTGRFAFNIPIKRVGVVPGNRALFSISTDNELKLFGPIAFEGKIPEMLAYKLGEDLKEGLFVGDRLFVGVYPQKIVTFDVFDKTIAPYEMPIASPVLSLERQDNGIRFVTENRVFDFNPQTHAVRVLLERFNTKTYSIAMAGSTVFLDQVSKQESPSRFVAGYDFSAQDASRVAIGSAVSIAELGLIVGCDQTRLALADAKTLKISLTDIPCNSAFFDAAAGRKYIFALSPKVMSGSSSSDTGDTLFGGDEDALVVRKLDLKGKQIGILSHPDDGSTVTAFKVLPELELILTGSDDGLIRVYEDSSIEPRNTFQTGVGRIMAFHRHKDQIVVVGDRGIEVRKSLASDEASVQALSLEVEPFASAINAQGSLLLGGDHFHGLVQVENPALSIGLRPTRYRVSAVAMDDAGNYSLGLDNGGLLKGDAGEGLTALSVQEGAISALGYVGPYLVAASGQEVKLGHGDQFQTISYLGGVSRVVRTSEGFIISGESELQQVSMRMELLQKTGCEWLIKADRPEICQ